MLTRARPWLPGLVVGFTLGTVLGVATVSRGTSGRTDAGLESRVARIEATLQGLQGFIDHVGFVAGSLNGVNGPHLLFEGVNVHIRSGSGATDDGAAFPPIPGELHGLGNLFIGYNEAPAGLLPGERGGSHTLVIGDGHRFTGAAGLVAGVENTVASFGSSVTGGSINKATGPFAMVAGGQQNSASGMGAVVGGGTSTVAAPDFCWRVEILNNGCTGVPK